MICVSIIIILLNWLFCNIVLAESTNENLDDISVAEGNVISTDPQANVELEKGSIVNMVVSKGKEIIMPDLVSAGYTYSEARNQLQSLGVTTIEKQEDRSYTTTTSDIVVGQYPAAGTVIDGPVTLYVSVATTSTNSTSTTGSSSSTSTSSSE